MRSIITGAAVAYAAVLSTLVATGAIGGAKTASFDTISVQRLNLREPDGTLRMVLSNKARFPGIVVKDKEIPHDSRRDVAGMIFFNDEGTENGGLVFNGARRKGVIESSGHLSFDQYEQDQVVTLDQTEDGPQRSAGLGVNDRPARSMDFAGLSRLEAMPAGAAKDAEIARLRAAGDFGQPRLFLGKADNNSQLNLRDAQGRSRLVLKVTAAGQASIQFLDETGKVVRTVTPGG